MKHSLNILLAINDAIIALDVEDLIQNHFCFSITTQTILEADQQLDTLYPEFVIVDCDVNYPSLRSFLNKIDAIGLRKICFCTSKRQASELKNDMTEVLLKPFDTDELISTISRIANLTTN